MKRVLRAFVYKDQQEKDDAKKNLGYARPDRLLNLSKVETEVLTYIYDFYAAKSEAPSLQLVHDYYETGNRGEETLLMEEIAVETFYASGSFQSAFEAEVEEQASQHFIRTVKDGVKIATQGLLVQKNMVKGVNEAVAHMFSSLRGKPPHEVGRLKASMRANDKALFDMYEETKKSPNGSYGILTGYGIIDKATMGISKKQFFLLAGFGGHLKSTLMFNMMVNATVDGGYNPLLFTSEMPSDKVQQVLIAIHSGNPKFNGVGRPLNSSRLLAGALQPPEEKFYLEVKDDFLNNPAHGNVRVIDSGDFTTFGSVQQRTVREHAEEEVDELYVDYITRLPIDAKYRGMDITSARNETIADGKRFSMSFDNGLGIPLISPFQVNREGFKQGLANEGRLSKTALAQYNAAEREADAIAYIFFDAEEQATSEPKVGMMKARWNAQPTDPVSVFIDPDSRRIFDMSAGMSPQTGYSPTAGGSLEETVTI